MMRGDFSLRSSGWEQEACVLPEQSWLCWQNCYQTSHKTAQWVELPRFYICKERQSSIFFFSSPLATDCTESELGGCHLLSHRLGKQASPPQHGWGGCWRVFTTLCLQDLGLMCCFLFLRQGKIKLGFEQNTERRSLSAPQCNLEKCCSDHSLPKYSDLTLVASAWDVYFDIFSAFSAL